MLSFCVKQFRVRSINVVILASCIAALSACGGGGGGGGGSPSASGDNPPSSSSVAAFTANAGADLTVDMGTKISLNPNATVVGAADFTSGQGNIEVKGASTNPKDIVSIAWTHTEGPAVAIQTNSTTSAVAFFIAPATGTEGSIKITYKLTIKNAGGEKAEDTVTFTILRVNQTPTVNAGSDQQVDGLVAVSLKAVANDPDGTIASYQWAQTAGTTAPITGATTATASFTAPTTEVDTTLEFELTVTDNNGLTAKDNVSVAVKPQNAPQLQLNFPPVVGIYKGSQISASGLATAKVGSISSVTVDIGTGPIAATVKTDGTWKIDGLLVPTSVTEFSLQVVATDSEGRISKTKSTLKTTGDNVGGKMAGGLTWSGTIGTAIESSKNVAYVLADGNLLKDLRLFSIDLTTGVHSADISNFSDTSKGINSSAVIAMAYDAEQHLVFVSTNPADVSLQRQIISINTTTGQRSLVSDSTRGTGANFTNLTGLTVGANHTLYAADNNSGTIVAVDTVTGNRTVVANQETSTYAIDAPLCLVSDVSQTKNRLFMVPNVSSNYILELNLLAAPVSSTLVTNSGNSAQGTATIHSEPQGIVVDPKLNALFVDDQSVFSQIIKVDLTTGNRTKLLATDWLETRITYDTQKQLLYLVDGIFPGLFVADPMTGQKVLISR